MPWPDPGLGHDVTSPKARIDRGERILVDELDLASHLTQLAGVESEQVDPLEGGGSSIWLDEPQQQAPGRRLARARLPDQPVRLALIDRDVDLVDGLHEALATAPTDREALRQPSSIEERGDHVPQGT